MAAFPERRPFDAARGNLPPFGHHQIGLDDVLVGQDHIERRIENQTAARAFEVPFVLTRDILTVPDEEIKQAKVAFTIIGGKVVYKGQ